MPRLGPIALPISLPALQHAVTTTNILLSHSLPLKNRRMTNFLGALGALHPLFFVWGKDDKAYNASVIGLLRRDKEQIQMRHHSPNFIA